MTNKELIDLLSAHPNDDQIMVEHSVQIGDGRRVKAQTSEPKVYVGDLKGKPTIWICIEEDHAND